MSQIWKAGFWDHVEVATLTGRRGPKGGGGEGGGGSGGGGGRGGGGGGREGRVQYIVVRRPKGPSTSPFAFLLFRPKWFIETEI